MAKKASEKTAENNELDVAAHVLVPKHELVSVKEKTDLMKKYEANVSDFPKIHSTDPAISQLKLKDGDIIKITRDSPTAGTSTFYRVVVTG